MHIFLSKQLLLLTFCDSTVGIGSGTGHRDYGRMTLPYGWTDVKVEIAM